MPQRLSSSDTGGYSGPDGPGMDDVLARVQANHGTTVSGEARGEGWMRRSFSKMDDNGHVTMENAYTDRRHGWDDPIWQSTVTAASQTDAQRAAVAEAEREEHDWQLTVKMTEAIGDNPVNRARVRHRHGLALQILDYERSKLTQISEATEAGDRRRHAPSMRSPTIRRPRSCARGRARRGRRATARSSSSGDDSSSGSDGEPARGRRQRDVDADRRSR